MPLQRGNVSHAFGSFHASAPAVETERFLKDVISLLLKQHREKTPNSADFHEKKLHSLFLFT